MSDIRALLWKNSNYKIIVSASWNSQQEAKVLPPGGTLSTEWDWVMWLLLLKPGVPPMGSGRGPVKTHPAWEQLNLKWLFHMVSLGRLCLPSLLLALQFHRAPPSKQGTADEGRVSLQAWGTLSLVSPGTIAVWIWSELGFSSQSLDCQQWVLCMDWSPYVDQIFHWLCTQRVGFVSSGPEGTPVTRVTITPGQGF
jgi:hypothetical protein